MKLHNDIDQGSKEWLALRQKHYCASEAAAALNLGKFFPATPQQLARVKRGLDTVQVTAAMQRGHEREPIIRAMVEASTGVEFPPAIATSEGKYLASLDGYAEEENVILEIKAPASANSETVTLAQQGCVLPAYEWQIQHQFMVTRADLCIYAVENPDTNEIYQIEVRPDVDMIADLRAAWNEFEYWMACDEKELADYPELSSDLRPLVQRWKKAKELLDEATAQEKAARAALLADAPGKGAGMGVRIHTIQRKGSIDYKTLLADHPEIDAEPYRKAGTEFVRLETLKK